MAARGTKVIISTNPQGKFLEGIVSGTPKPGTCMAISAAFSAGGKHTWAAFSRTDGYKGLVAVLTEDDLQGKTITDAYVTGTRCFLYCPAAGEELNMLVGDVAGTADDIAVGDYFRIDGASGKLEAAAGSDADHMVPFQALAAAADPAADYLLPVLYTGH